ncbi:MAG: alpha/beta fold hydrolase, partial [Stellaceae bacterium]
MTLAVERSFISVASARIHIALCGTGAPVLLLHQTPRSWDEFREVLPLLGEHYCAIAMDTAGYGDSDPLAEGEASIEAWADAARQLLDALGIARAAVVGHHTGAAIAAELAAACPDRVAALILSACPYNDAARRAAAPAGHTIDDAVSRGDGRHLMELWALRQAFYPPGRIDLLERFILDALKAGPRAAEGHRAVARYAIDRRLPLISCPTLVIAPTADPHAYPNARNVAAAIAGSTLIEIEDG